VAAVQGNVPRLGLDFNTQSPAVLDNHVAETLRLAEDVGGPGTAADGGHLAGELLGHRPSAQQPMPPPASPRPPAPSTHRSWWGTVLAAPDYNPAAAGDHQFGAGVGSRGRSAGPPRQAHRAAVRRIPPWRDFFVKFSDYAERAGYFIPGSGSGVVQAAGIPIGVAHLLGGDLRPRGPRQRAQRCATAAVPTNNATFDETMSVQQLAFARLRAVEHDR
jgi:apolipoprotein N-acyltransferase